MSSSKNSDLQRDFAAGVYLSKDTYSHREGGGGVEPERRLEGQQFTKLGRKYRTNMTDCIFSL